MANAADYLLLDTPQLLTTYKLRTRSIEARRFVATNIAPNYILSVDIVPNISGVTVTPSSFILQPNEISTITVEYDTSILETLPASTINGALDITVSATPVVVPQIPTPPALPPLPEAPVQIVSRIQITPTNYTLSQVGETKQYTAILYVGDQVVPATFSWDLNDNLAEAFKISEDGVVKAIKNAVNTATVVARVVEPREYSGTTGLANIASNIPIIVQDGGPPVPTTGNLTVIVNGVPDSIGGNVNISGINQSISKTTTFNNIAAGTYTVTPNVVTFGNENYNPTGGGQVYVSAGTTQQIVVSYTRQAPPDVNSIQILQVTDSFGNKLTDGAVLNVGDRFNVVAQTFRNGLPTGLGPIKFVANGTKEGVQDTTADASGQTSATFTVSEQGVVTISAINSTAGSITGTISAVRRTDYSIKILSPAKIIAGQCTPVTAVVLQDGIETNIPVEISISGLAGRITADPCGVQQPAPTFGGGNIIIDMGANIGGGATTGGQFNQVVGIDQGINLI